MGNTITIRLPEELGQWLEEEAKLTGLPKGQIVREQLQLSRTRKARQPFLDLADLCLIRLSELNPKLPVITVDGDFRLYRRNRRESIPVVMPPDVEL